MRYLEMNSGVRLHELAKIVLELPEKRRKPASPDHEAPGNFLGFSFYMKRVLGVLLLLQKTRRIDQRQKQKQQQKQRRMQREYPPRASHSPRSDGAVGQERKPSAHEP
jgi:hypothetical protein